MEDDFSVQVPDILEEIPKSSRPPSFAGKICREILNEIRSLSFLIEDEESIWDDVKEKLEELRSLLQKLKVAYHYYHHQKKVTKESQT